MKCYFFIILLSATAAYALDTEYSNEQDGVRVKLIGLDTKTPMIRLENSKNLTLAIRFPLSLAVSFWNGEERILERNVNGPQVESWTSKQSRDLITFLPPGANIELPLESLYFNTKEIGYGRNYEWSRGISRLPSGKYTAKLTSNGLGITVLDVNTSPFKKNFDIPAFEITVP